MERMYTVLLDTGARSAGRHRGARSAFENPLEIASRLMAEPPQPALHRERLSPQELGELAREPEFVSAAEIMRTRLIGLPVEEGGEPSTRSKPLPDKPWGISAVGAEHSRLTGAGTTVAMLDSGVDAAHPAFRGVDLMEKDFTGRGNGDCHGHGTHCTGIVLGRDVEGVRIGIARGVRRALIGKVTGPEGGDTDTLFRGLGWAHEQGAEIILLSTDLDFGASVSQRIEEGWPEPMASAAVLDSCRANRTLFRRLLSMLQFQEAFTGGALIIAAAGDDSRRGPTGDFVVRACLASACDRVVSVGSFDPDAAGLGLAVSSFSNGGASISAPGRSILSAAVGGELVISHGTGAAGAHVAGVAALWKEALSDGRLPANATAIRNKLLATAERRGFAAFVSDIDCGAGRVHAPQQSKVPAFRARRPLETNPHAISHVPSWSTGSRPAVSH